jgi:GNAT superfamily N-acetyltransferase
MSHTLGLLASPRASKVIRYERIQCGCRLHDGPGVSAARALSVGQCVRVSHEIRALAPTEMESVAAVLGLARLHQGDGMYLVAWENREPLAHAHLALTDPPELQDVEVRPEYRRLGIASALTARAEDEARMRGFDRLRVGVSVDNAAAQALYRECGYVDAGVPPERVRGTIEIRTGPIEVDDTILMWEKRL